MNKIIIKDKEIFVDGRIFVISDIHACIKTFKKLLKKVEFSEKDFLIINGDIIDRGGPNNISLIKYISSYDNICLVRGNHEEFYLRNDSKDLESHIWSAWGGKNLLLEFIRTKIDDKLLFHNYIIRTPLYVKVEIDNEKYFISHNGFNVDLPIIKKDSVICLEETIIEQYNTDWLNFFISNDIHYIPTQEFEYYFIVGHTPTIKLQNEPTILKKKYYMDIDCGATYKGGQLAIVCLNDFSVIYSKIDKEDLG